MASMSQPFSASLPTMQSPGQGRGFGDCQEAVEVAALWSCYKLSNLVIENPNDTDG
jgi:hypothetical protein